jgi:membrane-associated protein
MLESFFANQSHDIYVYLFLGLLIFVETGLVIFPFLPGDSILFLAGSLIALYPGHINIWLLIFVLSTVAFLANTLNYEIGRLFGKEITKSKKLSKLLKPQYLEDAKKFFEKHGSWAIFLGRFMPIIRTVIPFTAGGSLMPYRKFLIFNYLGGLSWVSVATLAGYFLGGIPFVKAHFEIIMLGIILVSFIPAILTGIKQILKNRQHSS